MELSAAQSTLSNDGIVMLWAFLDPLRTDRMARIA